MNDIQDSNTNSKYKLTHNIVELYVKVDYLWEDDLSVEKDMVCFVFGVVKILAKNFVLIFLQFFIFCFCCFLPKNAAMHPCVFFGGGTKLKTACDALLNLSKFPQPHEHNLFFSFPLHSLSLSTCWHLSVDIEET